ncbi:MAG: AmmeMemoRadiSam system protein B, partial [Candidatus Atribacteria bacterium]|nr:AmmeMemoRadiSam system protein B [Candidatus Atribacteria bacterium]
NGASICGPGPISVVIEVCKKLGIAKGQLLTYATSGDVSGIYDQVVGYASIIFQ